jgi:outer membrane lipoprotein-sorting protein
MAARLTRRAASALIAAAFAAPALAALTPEDQALVARARAYLMSLSSGMGRFTQTDPRGQESGGTFYLQRPGRARFAYDPPSGLVIASNGYRVAVLNNRLKTLDAYPIGATPLGLLLSRDIRIDKGVAIGKVTRFAGGFSILATDAGKRGQGSITLDFADKPIALTGWTVTDAQGGKTRVRLADFGPSRRFPSSLFELKPPPGAR